MIELILHVFIHLKKNLFLSNKDLVVCCFFTEYQQTNFMLPWSLSKQWILCLTLKDEQGGGVCDICRINRKSLGWPREWMEYFKCIEEDFHKRTVSFSEKGILHSSSFKNVCKYFMCWIPSFRYLDGLSNLNENCCFPRRCHIHWH